MWRKEGQEGAIQRIQGAAGLGMYRQGPLLVVACLRTCHLLNYKSVDSMKVGVRSVTGVAADSVRLAILKVLL